MTLLDKLNRFAPYICRFVARTKDGRRGLTANEISAEAGLPLKKVYEISRLKKWDDVKLGDAVAFAKGCGVNMLHLRRHKYHLKSHKNIHALKNWDYLKKLSIS